MSDEPIQDPPAEEDDFDSIRRSSIAAVASWNADRWTAWFFQAVYDKPRNYAPLMLSGEADLATEIASLHRRASSAVGEAMKAGLVTAIDECPLAKGPEGLRKLALVAGRLRASRAVPALVEMVSRNHDQLRSTAKPRYAALQECVAVLAGFAKQGHETIRLLFGGLAAEPAIVPQLSGLLMLGLTICDPPNFAKYFDRYVERRRELTGYFGDASVIEELFRAVPARTIHQNFATFSTHAQQYLVDHGGPLFKDVFGLSALGKQRKDALPGEDFETFMTLYQSSLPREGVMKSFYKEVPQPRPRPQPSRRKEEH